MGSPASERQGQHIADDVMGRIVDAVEELWLDRWSILVAVPATITAADDVVTCVAHGHVNGDPVVLFGLDGGDPLEPMVRYFVRDVTVDTFKLAATAGGAAIDVTEDGTADVSPGVRPSYIDQALLMQCAALYDRRKSPNGVIAPCCCGP
jgi:hypothetical protein